MEAYKTVMGQIYRNIYNYREMIILRKKFYSLDYVYDLLDVSVYILSGL